MATHLRAGSRRYSLPKNLLVAREYWQESPLSVDENALRARAAAKGAQRIVVIYRRATDFEQLHRALLHFWSGFTNKLLVEPLKVAGEDTPASCLDKYLTTHAAPNVLFYFPSETVSDQGSGSAEDGSFDWDQRRLGERELRHLLLVSQCLIRRAGTKPLELYHCYVRSDRVANIYREGFAGLFRAVAMECPPHRYRNFACAQMADLSDYKAVVSEWLAAPSAPQAPVQSPELSHQADKRYVTRFREWHPAVGELENASVFRAGATYLMVGGLGEVGLQMCLALARAFQPRLVILSRRGEDRGKNASLDRALGQLEQAGAQVVYRSVDVTDAERLREVLDAVRADVGPVHGVFHFARAVQDGLLQEKTFAGFRKAIAAKVTGTLNVDLLTADDPLEFFIVFSSMAAFGIAGSADYGYATAFQNAFVRDRNRKLLERKRRGASVALCWGQWVVDAFSDPERDAMLRKMGFDFIDAPFALQTMVLALHELQAALEHRAGGAVVGDVLGIMAINDKRQIRELYGLTADDGRTDPKRGLADRIVQAGHDDDDLSVAELVALNKRLNGDAAALKAALADHSYSQLHMLYESLTTSG